MAPRRAAGTVAFNLVGLLLVLATVPLSWAFLDATRPAALPTAGPSPAVTSPEPTSSLASAAISVPPSQTPGPTLSYGNGTWAKAASLDHGLWGAAGVVLADGRVLVAGGTITDTSKGAVAAAKLIDPTTGGWTAAHDMLEARAYPMAVLLGDGSVLVAGGSRDGLPLATAERFIPDASASGSGKWVSAGRMATPRTHATATLLPDGRVLVAGGGKDGDPGYRATATAEIYDPANGQWTPATSMARARVLHAATLLPSGEVLVTGGCDTYRGTGTVSASAELYDAKTNTWHAAAPMSAPRYTHSAALLPDGRVLVAGGWSFTTDTDPSLSTTEVYDPTANAWTTVGSMRSGRAQFRLAVLPDGRILAAGGVAPSYGILVQSDLFDPRTSRWSATGDLPQAVMWPVLVALRDGRALLAGGALNAGAGEQSALIAIYAPPPPPK